MKNTLALTITPAAVSTRARAERLARWLEEQARALTRQADEYAPRFRARLMGPSSVAVLTLRDAAAMSDEDLVRAVNWLRARADDARAFGRCLVEDTRRAWRLP